MTWAEVWDNEELTIEAKAIYGLLCTYAGSGSEAYPSVDLMCNKLKISRARFYKHLNLLIDTGVVKKKMRYENGLRESCVYTLIPNSLKEHYQQLDNVTVDSETVDNPTVDNLTSNNNSINNNSINNNSINKGYKYTSKVAQVQPNIIMEMYNNICTSYPKVTKMSESRKKAINARLKIYPLEDFKRLFEMAEESRFLKGGNNRNWSANFDWLIKDSNMAKVLDGNYSDNTETRQQEEEDEECYFDRFCREERERIERGEIPEYKPSPDAPFQ